MYLRFPRVIRCYCCFMVTHVVETDISGFVQAVFIYQPVNKQANKNQLSHPVGKKKHINPVSHRQPLLLCSHHKPFNCCPKWGQPATMAESNRVSQRSRKRNSRKSESGNHCGQDYRAGVTQGARPAVSLCVSVWDGGHGVRAAVHQRRAGLHGRHAHADQAEGKGAASPHLSGEREAEAFAGN